MNFSDAQHVALEHICYLGEETAHPRFARRVNGSSRATQVLTINSGYE